MFNKRRDLERRVWNLENPAKYNIGEKVEFYLEGYECFPCKGLIIDVDIKHFRFDIFSDYQYRRRYEVINKRGVRYIVKESSINK